MIIFDFLLLLKLFVHEVFGNIEAGVSFYGWQGRELKQPYYVRNSHLGYHATLHHANYFHRDQLYDLSSDPEEKINLFHKNPEKVKEMREMLMKSLNTFDKRPYGEIKE